MPWVPGLDLRFHLGVDGISYPLVVLTALLTLLCCALHALAGARTAAAGRDAGRAAAGHRGRHPRHLPRPRPGAVLRLLRGRAAADVRGDRRSGAARTGGTRPASSCSTRCSARCCCWSASSRWSPAPAPPTWSRSPPARPTCRRGTQLAAFIAARGRVRGEESTVAAAHLAARRAHRGADGRHRDPGRRAAEDGHVRPDPGRRRRGAGGRRGGPRRCSACWPSPRSSSAALVCLAQTELKRLIAYSSASGTWASCCSASPR